MIHVGRYLEHRGDVRDHGGYLEYCGGVQYRRGCHECRVGYLEYCGGAQYHGDIMMHVARYH